MSASEQQIQTRTIHFHFQTFISYQLTPSDDNPQPPHVEMLFTGYTQNPEHSLRDIGSHTQPPPPTSRFCVWEPAGLETAQRQTTQSFDWRGVASPCFISILPRWVHIYLGYFPDTDPVSIFHSLLLRFLNSFHVTRSSL